MTNLMRGMLFGALIIAGSNTMASAADLNGTTSGLTNEVRGGVLYHDLMNRESGVDINAEILLRWAAVDFTIPGLGTNGMLRPHFGGNLNLSGDTSMVYAGYTLTLDLTDWMFIEGSFGGMAHNGNTRKTTPNTLALRLQRDVPRIRLSRLPDQRAGQRLRDHRAYPRTTATARPTTA